MKKKGKYLEKSPVKVAIISRLIAKAVDLFIFLILSLLFYPIGILLGIAYLSIADSLQNGQSVGKKLIGFSVISLDDGSPCSFKQSAIRNLPIMVPAVFAIVPIWGWLLAVFVGVPLIILEVYLMFALDSGHRVGDVMADTTVIATGGDKLPVAKLKDGWFDSTTTENSV